MWLCFGAAIGFGVSGPAASIRIEFASLDEGQGILRTRDGFIQRLSPFDRASRLKTDREVSEPEFLRFVASKVLRWEPENKIKVRTAFSRIQPVLAQLALDWPQTVHFIKTTGEEEGGAAYTRGRAIVIPKARLDLPSEKFNRLIAHEFFHILSRHDPEIRDRLYRAIGFEKCGEIELPAPLASRRITNPDAPFNAHWIRVRRDQQPFRAVPVLFSKSERYDPEQGGNFFKYLQFRLLLIEAGKSDSVGISSLSTTRPRLVEVKEVSGFFEQVGKNTQYIIHPEEILAVNFALIVMGETDFPSPDVAEKIRAILKEDGEQRQ